MSAAKREAWRRFEIVVAVWVSAAALWSLACYLATPTFEADPRSPVVFAIAGLFLVMVGACIGAYWYVYRRLRSECPNCHKRSATLVSKPPDDVYLECARCGYSAPTGWSSSS